MRSAGLRMAVAVKLEGDYSRIRRTWLSVLLPCGHICRHREDEQASLLVLSTTLHGYVAWEVRMKKDDDIGRLDFGIEGERSLRIGAVEDPAEWDVTKLRVACPSDAAVKGSADIMRLVPDGTKLTLLE